MLLVVVACSIPPLTDSKRRFPADAAAAPSTSLAELKVGGEKAAAATTTAARRQQQVDVRLECSAAVNQRASSLQCMPLSLAVVRKKANKQFASPPAAARESEIHGRLKKVVSIGGSFAPLANAGPGSRIASPRRDEGAPPRLETFVGLLLLLHFLRARPRTKGTLGARGMRAARRLDLFKANESKAPAPH